MGNYENLKQSITDVIRTNGNQEITGAVLQSALLTIISTVGANATFAGIATPTTNPGTPDGPVFYLASESGTYTNFNATELQDGLSVLMWNDSWSSQQIFSIDDEPTAGSKNLVESGGVYEAIQTNKKTRKIEIVGSVDDDEEIEIVASDGKVFAKIKYDYADFKNLKSNGKDVAQKEYVDNELATKQDGLKDVLEKSILDSSDSIELETDNGSKVGEIQAKEIANSDSSVEITDNTGQIIFVKLSNKGIQANGFFLPNGNSLEELAKYGVYSKIFKTIRPAWSDVDNNYESWPFNGLLIQDNKLKFMYNCSDAHVDKHNSNAMMREKEELGTWYPKHTVIEHTSVYSYRNPGCCVLDNGDIFVIVVEQDAISYPNVDVGKFVKLRSTDGGETWINEGRVQVNGQDVVEECMMSVFCTSNGDILSFVGGIYGGKYIVSTDNGLTWNYIGDDFGIGAEEASFLERADGSILSILRKNRSSAALISISSDLTTVTTLYDFGRFNFNTYWNPTSITKLHDGKILLLGCNRIPDHANITYGTIMEAIVSEQDILDNNISPSLIARFQAPRLNDFGYITAVEFNDGIVYAYFYGGEIAGTAKIWEMVGKY